MPDTLQDSGYGDTDLYNGDVQQPVQSGPDSGSNKVADDAVGPERSIRAPSKSETSIPCPFDSQSFIEGHARENCTQIKSFPSHLIELIQSSAKRSLGDRIRNALHLEKSYPPGFGKGRVDQIIRSRRSLPSETSLLTLPTQ